MAKLKNDNSNNIEEKKESVVDVVEDNVEIEIPEAPVVEKKTAEPQIDMNQIYNMLNNFQNTINDLQRQLDEEKRKNAVIVASQNSNSGTERLIELLGNKKSDREVTILHNRELIGGLSTSIRLTGITIDFHTLGEQRILSWQQFEECVSKYRKWFDKEIILLAPEHEDLSERYNVPCLKRAGKNIITKSDLQTLYKMDERALEDFVKSLSIEDQGFVCSYWLGKCYENDEKYLNRSKIELLNRVSGKGIFDTLLTAMNFGSIRN